MKKYLLVIIIFLVGCTDDYNLNERLDNNFAGARKECVIFAPDSIKHHVLLYTENHPSEYNCSKLKEFIVLDIYPPQIVWNYGYDQDMCGYKVGDKIATTRYSTKSLVSNEYKTYYWQNCLEEE